MSGMKCVLEVVNTNLYTPYYSASNFDVALRTENTNQSFFIGNGSNATTFAGIILQSNNVGIGKTPTTNLDVAGNVYIGSNLTIKGTLTACNVNGFSKSTQGSVAITMDGPGAANAITFLNSNATEFMRVASNGYVGINNQNPQYLLDVSGSANVMSNIKVGGNMTVSNINFVGALTSNGTPFVGGGGGGIASSCNFGTMVSPLNGCTLNFDISTYANSVIELSSNIPASNLTINLYCGSSPTLTTSQVGCSGNIVLIERSPMGRSVYIDSKINLPYPMSNVIQTTPAYSNAYSVDTLNYIVASTAFALGSYTRNLRSVSVATVTSWLAGIGSTSGVTGLANSPSDGGFYATGYYNSNLVFYNASNAGGTIGAATQYSVILGDSNSSLSYYDSFLAKYSSMGSVNWVAQLGNSSTGTSGNFQSYASSPCTDGGVFVTGTYTSNFVAYNSNNSGAFGTIASSNLGYDVFLAKYGSNGSVGWLSHLSSSTPNIYPNVIGTNDGGCIVVCQYSANLACYDNVGNTSNLTLGSGLSNMAVVKFDNAGKLTASISGAGSGGWMAKVGNSGSVSACNTFSVAQGGDEGVYVGGWYTANPLTFYDQTMTAYGTTLPKSPSTGYDSYIIKYTSTGSIAMTSTANPWITHIGGTSASAGNAAIYSMNATNDGGLVVAGNFNVSPLYFYSTSGLQSPYSIQPTNSSGNAGTYYDAFVVKYNSDGIVQWVTTFKSGNTGSIYPTSLTNNWRTNNIVIGGYYAATTLTIYTGALQTATLPTLTNSGGTDSFVMNLNTVDGTLAWVSRLGGTSADNVYCMMSTTDGGVIVGGQSTSTNLYVYNSLNVQYGLSLTCSTQLYPFTTFTFTNMGASGATGPTAITYGTSTPGYGTSYAMTLGTGTFVGWQYWTVPATGTYIITTVGGGGGTFLAGTGGQSCASSGLSVTGTYNLIQGHILRILVGHGGSYYNLTITGVINYYVMLGGGGSFIYNSSTSSLLQVGGGGGWRKYFIRYVNTSY